MLRYPAAQWPASPAPCKHLTSISCRCHPQWPSMHTRTAGALLPVMLAQPAVQVVVVFCLHRLCSACIDARQVGGCVYLHDGMTQWSMWLFEVCRWNSCRVVEVAGSVIIGMWCNACKQMAFPQTLQPLDGLHAVSNLPLVVGWALPQSRLSTLLAEAASQRTE